MNLQTAHQLAARLVDHLSPHCARVAIAGSIRRRAPDVGDIEIVAIPKPTQHRDLFGHPNPHAPTDLDVVLNAMEHLQRIKGGRRYRQYLLVDHDINLDLFLVLPPAQWGVIFAIRTGPARFSRWLVTPRAQGGALPSHLRLHDGGVYHGQLLQPTLDEADLFHLLGLPYIDPPDRQPGWMRRYDFRFPP